MDSRILWATLGKLVGPDVVVTDTDGTFDGLAWPEGFTPPTLAAFDAEAARQQAALAVPRQIANWKAHAILEIRGKHADVVAVIAAITDPVKRMLVQTAFDRLDPLPRDSATLVELLTAAGFDGPGIDQLFIDGDALQVDP